MWKFLTYDIAHKYVNIRLTMKINPNNCHFLMYTNLTAGPNKTTQIEEFWREKFPVTMRENQI